MTKLTGTAKYKGNDLFEIELDCVQDPNPDPVPNPPQPNKLDIYLTGLHLPSEMEQAIDPNGGSWQYGLGIEGVRDVDKLNRVITKANELKKHICITITDGMHTYHEIEEIALSTNEKYVDAIHIEQDNGNHNNNPPYWTNDKWNQLVNKINEIGDPTKLYCYRTMWSKRYEDVYPDAIKWPQRATTCYPRYNKDAFSNGAMVTGQSGSLYPWMQIHSWLSQEPNRTALTNLQLFGQPLNWQQFSSSRRAMVGLSRQDYFGYLLMCQWAGINKVLLYSARVGEFENRRPTGRTDLIWNLPKGALGKSYWDAKHVVEAYMDNKFPNIRPGAFGYKSPEIIGTGDNYQA